jgi:hypothetical protein
MVTALPDKTPATKGPVGETVNGSPSVGQETNEMEEPYVVIIIPYLHINDLDFFRYGQGLIDWLVFKKPAESGKKT